MTKTCLIIGAGPAGLTAALSLSKIGISCMIHELRPTASTIGGSINLTPSALRLLEYLDVELHGCRVDSIEIFSLHTGKRLADLPVRKYGPALRVLREELLRALLVATSKRGIEIVYGSKLARVRDLKGEERVVALFDGEKEVESDFILGCDGVHSAVRTQCVEPGRLSIYTKAAVAYAVVDATGITPHFHQTAMNSGRRGQLLTSYVDAERTKIYLGYVMSMPEEIDKQGWRTRAKDMEKTKVEIETRFGGSGVECVEELLERAENLVFYPVYNLGPGGRWAKGRVLLLGDAAHGMPPQGESTGLAIEDSVLLARVLSSFPDVGIENVFGIYEKTRRPRIDAAYKEAVFRWEGVKDRSWLLQKVLEWFLWVFLWWRMSTFEASFSYDVRKEKILS